MLDLPTRKQPGYRATRGQAEGVNRHGQAARVAVTHFNMAIDDHVLSGKTHCAHADRIPELFQFVLQFGNSRIRIPRSDHAQGRGAFSEDHAGVFQPAEPDPDDRRLAGKPAFSESQQAVEIEAPNSLDAVRRKQHPVVGAEKSALVHGNQIYPVALWFERVLDLRSSDSHVVFVIGAPERMNPVRAERHAVGCFRRRLAQRSFLGAHPALDPGFVSELDEPARHAGVSAHRASVLRGRRVIVQHRLQHEGREVAVLGRGGAFEACEIVFRDLDGCLAHQVARG